MSGVLRGFRVVGVIAVTGVVLVKLLGAIRTFEFVTLAGNAYKRHRHHQKGEKFHRAAS